MLIGNICEGIGLNGAEGHCRQCSANNLALKLYSSGLNKINN